MKIVHLDGKPYAVNLWWQVRAGGAATRSAMLLAARDTAKDLKEPFTCVALRSQQYGLGFGAVTVALPSLAAALRPVVQMNQGFLGVFSFEEEGRALWWVCGISRGAVAASGDRIFDTKDTALAHVRQLRDLFGASEEVVQDSPEASERFLLPLLTDDARVESLFPDPARRQGLLRAAGVAALILALCAGGKWLWDARVQDSALKNARQLTQSKDDRRREILANPGQHFPRSWLDVPTVRDVGVVCLPELMAVPLSGSGWALESAICRPGSLVLTWNHRPGASYTRLPLEARLENPKKAVGQRKLPRPDPRKQDDPLLTREAATSNLYEITRRLNCRLKLNWAAPEKKLVDDVEVSAPWVRGTWQMEAVPSLLLTDGFTLLNALPGLSVSEILFDKSWAMKGDVYANLK